MPKQLHDHPSYSIDLKKDMPMPYRTAMNHYIDIGGGEGLFGDFDGFIFYMGLPSMFGDEGGTVDTATAVWM